ncbi:MAG TPA: 4Fe-4S binding protein [Dehalococcoidia bacterium]|nr:4Fe-4S binding protein [Dehalococcoidia bacterium]
MSGTVLRRPLDLDTVTRPVGQVFIIPERCKGCRFCIDFCPEQVLVDSDGMNARGYHYPVVAPGKEEACVNCSFCKLVCPEFAIYTEEM